MNYISPQMLITNALQNYSNPMVYKPPFLQTGSVTCTKSQLEKSMDEYLKNNEENLITNEDHAKLVESQRKPQLMSQVLTQPSQTSSQTSSQPQTSSQNENESFQAKQFSKIETFIPNIKFDSSMILKIILIIMLFIILIQFFKIENLKTVIKVYKLNEMKKN